MSAQPPTAPLTSLSRASSAAVSSALRPAASQAASRSSGACGGFSWITDSFKPSVSSGYNQPSVAPANVQSKTVQLQASHLCQLLSKCARPAPPRAPRAAPATRPSTAQCATNNPKQTVTAPGPADPQTRLAPPRAPRAAPAMFRAPSQRGPAATLRQGPRAPAAPAARPLPGCPPAGDVIRKLRGTPAFQQPEACIKNCACVQCRYHSPWQRRRRSCPSLQSSESTRYCSK